MIAATAPVRNGLRQGCRIPVAATLLLAVLLSGCPEVDNPYLPYPEPDFDDFVVEIQPIVRKRCANNGCHGSVDRPLTLYGVGYLRAQPDFPGTPMPEFELTPAELAWNYDAMRIRMLGAGSADEATLLLKCLDPAVGGIAHDVDLVVFESRDEADYIRLRDWIEGGL